MNRMAMFRIMLCGLAAIISDIACGTVYYLTGTETSSSKALEENARWTDNATPTPSQVAPLNGTAEDEYIANAAFRVAMSSGNLPAIFGIKSLTLQKGGLTWKVVGTPETASFTFPLLCLEGGLSGSTQKGYIALGSSGMGWIDGNIEVKTARATPYYFTSSQASAESGFGLDADLIGESTAGLRFSCPTRSNRMKIILGGDNSGYRGNIQLDEGNIWIQFKDGNAFGGSVPALDSEALVLNDGSILEVTTQGASLPASKNRGITVHGANAASNVQFRAEADWTLGCQLAGDGLIEKTGAGCLTIDTDWPATMGELIVKEGSIAFTSGHQSPCKTVLEGYSVKASCADTTAQTVLDLGDGFLELKAPIGIVMSNQPSEGDIASERIIPVLKVKSATTLRPCDFVISGLTPAAVRCEVLPIVEMVSGGYQLVSVRLDPYVLLSADWKTAMGGKYCPASDVEGVWADGKIPGGGNGHYCVATSLNTPWSSDLRVAGYNGSSRDWMFGGASLTLNGGWLGMKNKVQRFSDLRVTSGAKHYGVKFLGAAGGDDQEISGNITVMGSTRDGATMFMGSHGQGCVISANLLGSGWIQFIGNNDAVEEGESVFYLTGQNANFIGGMVVKAGTYTDKSTSQKTYNPARLVLGADADASTLGGRPFSPLPDALTIGAGGSLEVRSDFSYDVENRGLTFAAQTELVVSNAATFSVGQSVVLADGIQVSLAGAGTFAAKKVIGSGAAKLNIAEGGFCPLAATPLDGVALEFGANGALVVDADTTDADLLKTGLQDLNEQVSLASGVAELKIRILYDASNKDKVPYPTVGILTVPDDQAEAWRQRIKSAKVMAKGVSAKIDSISVGGLTTFKAELSSKGLILIFR